MRGVGRVALALGVAVMTASCGGGLRLTGGGGTPTASPSPSDPHYHQAVVEAQHLLSLARVPGGAVSLPASPRRVATFTTPASPHLVDAQREWSVPQPFDAVVAWIGDNPPAGLKLAQHGGGTGPHGSPLDAGFAWSAPDAAAYVEAQLEVSVVSDGADRSLVRAEGMDVWLTTAPEPDHSSGPFIHASVAGGCPASLLGQDVANPDPNLSLRMLPDADPVAALVCRYLHPSLAGIDQQTTPSQVTLDAARARHLARVIDAIRLGYDGGGAMSCPDDDGSVVLLVFHYASGSDVALWYHAAGCEYLDNGHVRAEETVNPSFYEAFITAMNALP